MMADPSEQALPFSEVAREAAAGWVGGDVAWADDMLAAAVDADPRAKAFLKLAALTDEELVGRLAAAFENRVGTTIGVGDGMRAAVAALGLPVAEQEPTGGEDASR